MSVRVERNGPVTTVILDRPGVRNAIDRATAESLSAAFRAFERDDEARVAVLWGDHGTFCAGADFKGHFRRASPTASRPTATARWAPRA